MAKLPTDFKTARQRFLEADPDLQQQILAKYPVLGMNETELINKISVADDEMKGRIYSEYPEFKDPEYLAGKSAGIGETLWNVPAGALAATGESIGGGIRAVEELAGTGTEYGKDIATESTFAAQGLADKLNLKPESSWNDFAKNIVYSGATSAAQQLPIIAATVANPAIAPGALALMAAQSAGSRYQQAREENYTPEQAAVQGVVYGGAEAAGEYLPINLLLKRTGLDAGAIAKKIVGYVATEVGSELGTEAMQYTSDKVAKIITENPDANVQDLYPRLRDTALSTLVAAPILGGAGVITQKMTQPSQPTITPQEIQAATDEQNAITTQSDEEIARRAAEVLAQPEINVPTKDNVLNDYSQITGDTGAKIFMFGSREKGTAKDNSDYDIIIRHGDKIKYNNAKEYTQAVTPILAELKKKYPNADIQISRDDNYIDMLVEDARLNREENLKNAQETPQTVVEPPVVENTQAKVPNAPEVVITPNERVAETPSENIKLPDRLPIENIKQDAQLQFKRGVDKNLVTDKLKGRKFSELLSGPIDVFVNPEDGQTYVWNGNHRLQLAKDNNRPDVKVTYSNFANMEEAKSAAILKNLAENNGNPMDYRNFFKEAGDTDFKTLLNKMGEDGIDLSKGLAEKGFALSKLSDNLTREYEKGILPEGIAVAIGKNQLTEAAQNSLYKSIKSRYIDQGTAPNASVVKNLIEFARTAPETATEEDMFGNSEVVNNMMIKSEVAEYIGKTIRADKNILKKLSNENLAAAATERELGEIKTEQASAEAQKVALVEMYFKKRMSASGDTIALALNEATQRIVNGETPNKVKGETYVKIRQILESEAKNGFKTVTPKPASVEQNIPGVTEKQPERNAATEGVIEEPRPEIKPVAQTKKKISEIKTIEELVNNQKNLFDAKVTSIKDGTTATVDYKGKNFTVTETPSGLKYDELLPTEKPVKQEALFEEDLTAKEKDQKAEEKTKGLFGDYLAVPLNKPPANNAMIIGILKGLNQTDLVRLVEELDAIISVKERFRKDGILGAFYQKNGGKININALLGKVDAEALAKVIAHEIGHLIDWKEGAVNNTLRRGNLLGHIIAQVKFFKSAVNLDPQGQPRTIDNKQRRSLWNQARKTVQESAVYYENDLDQKLVSEEYRRLLSEFIDDNNLITNEVAKAELLNLTQVWWNLTDEQVDAQLDYLSKPSELYANAFSAFLTNPQFLHYNAPTVGKMIYDYMTVEKPEFYAVYRDMQNRISAGTNDKSNIEWLNTRIKEATDTRIQELIKRRPDEGLMTGIKRQYYDSLSALQALASKSGKLDTKFLETVENFRNYKDITEGFIERFFPEVIKDLTEQGLNIDDLKVPAFLKRIIGERGGKVIDVVSKEYAQKLNAELNTKFTPEQMKAINNAFVKLWENRQPLLNEIKDLGVFSDELMTYILNNKDYFTWDVVKKVDETIGKRSPATSAIIKKQIGAFSAVANPYVSTILKDFSLIKFAKKQALVKATLAKLKELGMEVKPAEKKFAHGFWEFQEPNPNTGLALVTVMEKGEVKGYYVEQGIATALENKPTEMSTAAKIVSYINAPIRASLTSANPVFIFGMNPIRDVVAAFLNMPYTLQHPILWTKLMAKEFAKAMPVINGLVETAADRQYKYKMRSEGKLLGEREAVGDPAFIKSEEDYLKTFYSNHTDLTDFQKAINKFTGFFSILEWVHNAGKRIEQAPKIAANKFYEQIKDEYNLTEADISYFVRNFAGSPDFRRKGTNYGGYNNFFMYSNAMKEGYRATAEAVKYSPKEFALKMAGLAIAPVVLTLLGEAGDPEWWAKVPEYAKSNYMVVPLGYDENKKPVYMRLPMTEAVRFFASGIRKIVKGVRGDDDTMKTLGNLIALGADEVPMAGPAIQTAGVLAQWMAGQNPYDFFRGREILSQREYQLRRAEPGTVAGKILQHIWNTNGGGTWYKFHPEYDKLEKSDIEKLTKMPAFGMNILGSFIKTGYDKPVEQDKELQFKVDETRAILHNLIDSAVEKTYKGKVSELTQEEKDAKRKDMAYFREKLDLRRHPEKAQKNKAKLLQKNIKKLGIK